MLSTSRTYYPPTKTPIIIGCIGRGGGGQYVSERFLDPLLSELIEVLT